MAVTNKDFKIKHGLIVEGSSATVNGNQVLTETASDSYILNLIGGETLVKSVSGNLSVDNVGDLSIDQEGLFDTLVSDGLATETFVSDAITTASSNYDSAGSASAAQSAAQTYADSLASNYDAAGSATTAENNAKGYADSLAVNYDAAGSASSAQSAAQTYADGLAVNYDAAGTAAALIDDASNLSTEVWSAYKTSTEISVAQTAAQDYADAAVADLVGSAPAVLDTIQELATALENNPDIIADLENVAAGKQDTLTAGNGIAIDGSTIGVAFDAGNGLAINGTNLTIDTNVIATKTYAEGVADDAETAANSYTDGRETAITTAYQSYADTAEADAKSYADGLAPNYDTAGTAQGIVDALDTDDIEEGSTNLYFTNSRAKTSAADLLTGASLTNITITGTGAGLTITAENGVADSDTDDLAEGSEHLYFTDERAIDAVSAADIYPNAVIINNLTKQVANQVTVATAGIATGISWAKADYRSAEFVVKVAYGDHTEISKVLMTLDVNDNIAITEYGNVTTNGSASSISADISGTDARLRVTTVNNASTVTVLGTLIK